MKLANEIQKKLITWCRSGSQDIIIPNFFIGGYEMDVFKMTASGLITEYEIKLSRADLLNDFKKYQYNKINQTRMFKHDEIKTGSRVCNRFFFVVPQGLISNVEIPKHIGLIEYTGYGFMWIRNAKLIHSTKQPESLFRELSVSLSNRSDILWKKLLYANETIKELQKQIKEYEKQKQFTF